MRLRNSINLRARASTTWLARGFHCAWGRKTLGRLFIQLGDERVQFGLDVVEHFPEPWRRWYRCAGRGCSPQAKVQRLPLRQQSVPETRILMSISKPKLRPPVWAPQKRTGSTPPKPHRGCGRLSRLDSCAAAICRPSLGTMSCRACILSRMPESQLIEVEAPTSHGASFPCYATPIGSPPRSAAKG